MTTVMTALPMMMRMMRKSGCHFWEGRMQSEDEELEQLKTLSWPIKIRLWRYCKLRSMIFWFKSSFIGYNPSYIIEIVVLSENPKLRQDIQPHISGIKYGFSVETNFHWEMRSGTKIFVVARNLSKVWLPCNLFTLCFSNQAMSDPLCCVVLTLKGIFLLKW